MRSAFLSKKELKRALSRKVKERIDDIISLNEALRAPN